MFFYTKILNFCFTFVICFGVCTAKPCLKIEHEKNEDCEFMQIVHKC